MVANQRKNRWYCFDNPSNDSTAVMITEWMDAKVTRMMMPIHHICICSATGLLIWYIVMDLAWCLFYWLYLTTGIHLYRDTEAEPHLPCQRFYFTWCRIWIYMRICYCELASDRGWMKWLCEPVMWPRCSQTHTWCRRGEDSGMLNRRALIHGNSTTGACMCHHYAARVGGNVCPWWGVPMLCGAFEVSVVEHKLVRCYSIAFQSITGNGAVYSADM